MTSSSPLISVVIACVNGLPSIRECLDALHAQRAAVPAEIVVVNSCEDGTADFIRTTYPGVRLIQLDHCPGIPEMRYLGMQQASGGIVGVLEDHCLVCDTWLEQVLEALSDEAFQVVGGPVENGARDRLVDWAVFLTEYSGMMPPIPDGEVAGVAGNNVAYRRAALDAVEDETLRTCWEFFIHSEMRERGIRFLSRPGLLVEHKKSFGVRYFVSQRYAYSRSFAGMRRSRMSRVQRWAYALASPLLAPLMLGRIGRDVVRKKRQERVFVRSLPVLVLFMLSYAVGEGVGYLFGPGRSVLRVE